MELQLPDSARVGKNIPKNKFYQKITVSNRLKREFTYVIQKITWLYKLSPATINIPQTDIVDEIQVFSIELKQRVIPKNVLKLIDKSVKYPILYVFTYESETAFGIALRSSGEYRYYFSAWNQPMDFHFTNTNLETVYQGLVTAFISEKTAEPEDFTVTIEKDKARQQLERQITVLKNKIKNEPQFNLKVALNTELQAKLTKLQSL